MSTGRMIFVCITLQAWAAWGDGSSEAKAHEAQIIQAIDRAQEDRDKRLLGYSVTEHYTLRNSRFDTPAELVVNATYSRGPGKVYQIVSRSGPSLLQTRVLDRLLKEEADMSRGEQRQHALMTSTNYQIKLTGREVLNGRACDTIELAPRSKGTHLVKGKAWVDAGTHALVRLEGKPTASVTFLVGRPDIVREYAQFEGFALAWKSHAVSESFLLGKTDLTIEYTGYRVNGAGAP